VCNDGVTIAKEIELADPEENLGAQMIREAAERTSDAVGDGTSSATILAHSIYADGLRNIAAGASAIDLKRGLDRGLRAAMETIRSMSRPVESRKEKAQIATISGHNNPALGELVADAMEKVGLEGAVSVERRRERRPNLRSSKGCSSTEDFSRPISFPTPQRCRLYSKTPSSSCTRKRSVAAKTLCHF
jgi:chaperonin GroEL